MSQSTSAVSARPTGERRLLLVLITCISLTATHFIHNSWFPLIHQEINLSPTHGYAFSAAHYAPDVYRMMMPILWQVGQRATGLDMAWVAAGLDFLFFLPMLLLLWWLVGADTEATPSASLRRLFASILLLALVQFPVAWITPWIRPETVPTAFFLAFATFCLVKGRRNPAWTAPLLIATVFQAFVRTDIPFLFGAAVALISFSADTSSGFGTRLATFLRGAAIAAISAGVQIYLQFFLYRGVPYPPNTAPIQLYNNLYIHNIVSALLALAPFLLTFAFVIGKRVRLHAIEAAAILSALLYLPIYFLVGIIGEVRIIVPCLLLLSAATARLAARALLDGSAANAKSAPTGAPSVRSL